MNRFCGLKIRENIFTEIFPADEILLTYESQWPVLQTILENHFFLGLTSVKGVVLTNQYSPLV